MEHSLEGSVIGLLAENRMSWNERKEVEWKVMEVDGDRWLQLRFSTPAEARYASNAGVFGGGFV
jgi:hypothetical protein